MSLALHDDGDVMHRVFKDTAIIRYALILNCKSPQFARSWTFLFSTQMPFLLSSSGCQFILSQNNKLFVSSRS